MLGNMNNQPPKTDEHKDFDSLSKMITTNLKALRFIFGVHLEGLYEIVNNCNFVLSNSKHQIINSMYVAASPLKDFLNAMFFDSFDTNGLKVISKSKEDQLIVDAIQ